MMTPAQLAGLFASGDDTWTTPRERFAEWDSEFRFSLDAAALASSALCAAWYGPDHPDPDRRNALLTDWARDAAGGAVWLNPPYGRKIGDFVRKADHESRRGVTVVCLLPARTDTGWWHESCIYHEVRFLRGRLRFGGSTSSAPFPSALVVMRPTVVERNFGGTA